jgi:hypothetical protein
MFEIKIFPVAQLTLVTYLCHSRAVSQIKNYNISYVGTVLRNTSKPILIIFLSFIRSIAPFYTDAASAQNTHLKKKIKFTVHTLLSSRHYANKHCYGRRRRIRVKWLRVQPETKIAAPRKISGSVCLL